MDAAQPTSLPWSAAVAPLIVITKAPDAGVLNVRPA